MPETVRALPPTFHPDDDAPALDVALLTEDGILAGRIVERAGAGFRCHWAASRECVSDLLSARSFPIAVVDSRIYDEHLDRG